MDYFTILAQTASDTSGEPVVPMDLFWSQITSLGLLEALTFISFGVVCLFYGWRVFKVLVVINFALIGMMLGMAITEKIVGLNNQFAGGIVGMIILAVLSVPLMRWAVCVLGAVAGGILTSGIWYACGLTERYIWAGGLIGIIAGGMISFIVFKAAVILFSSLWGSGLVVVGSLALLYQYDKTATKVEDLVFTLRWFLPTLIIAPTAIGFVLQHKFLKSSKDWDL
ncbi:MAG: hypothetical protein ACYS7Y_23410 [Planctomycetota bacterium]|jgi:hypothetical protein